MAAGKIDVYNLGDMGVARTRSPVHLKDGELISAQNTMTTRSGGRHALRKRYGMSLFNATTASGQIFAISQVAVTDPNAGDTD